MLDTLLVTYASRSGSTAGVAEVIGQTLAESGVSVVVSPMVEVRDISSYGAVVGGSAIRGGKWLPEALDFLQRQRLVLAQKPFAAFLVCITLAMPNAEKNQQGVMSWLGPVRTLVTPVSEGYFAGALDFGKLPLFPEGIMMRVPVALGIFPQGDHRNWDAIRTWARELKPILEARSP